jgi:hypothetical protein
MLAVHRPEQSTSTIIAARNASTAIVLVNNLLSPSARIEPTAVARRILNFAEFAIHFATSLWRVAFKGLLGLGARCST